MREEGVPPSPPGFTVRVSAGWTAGALVPQKICGCRKPCKLLIYISRSGTNFGPKKKEGMRAFSRWTGSAACSRTSATASRRSHPRSCGTSWTPSAGEYPPTTSSASSWRRPSRGAGGHPVAVELHFYFVYFMEAPPDLGEWTFHFSFLRVVLVCTRCKMFPSTNFGVTFSAVARRCIKVA